MFARAALTALVVAAALAAACTLNTEDKVIDSGARPLADGETIGAVEPPPGGTAVASSVITLGNVTCINGTLVVRTNLKSIIGKMDCEQAAPQAALDRLYGQSVSISYAGGRLRLASVSAASLEFSVQEPTIRDVDATP